MHSLVLTGFDAINLYFIKNNNEDYPMENGFFGLKLLS